MATVYSYVRFSHPDQMEGGSLERQRRASAKWAKENGHVLDTSLRLTDLGVSGFRGKHRDVGALGGFLRAVDRGYVAPGSILAVEAMDRLTREELNKAVELFLGILNKGVSIVTLKPAPRLYEAGKLEVVDLVQAVIELSAAHGYSKHLSERIGAGWGMGREAVREGKRKILTSKIPWWIRIKPGSRKVDPKTGKPDRSTGELELHPDRAPIMREIVDWSLAGVGNGTIAKRLDARRIPTPGKSPYWRHSTISQWLKKRALIGELGMDRGRDPLPDYFPALLTEAEFWRLQDVREQRRPSGRGVAGPTALPNLLAGLIFDARDGSTYELSGGGNSQPARYVNGRARLSSEFESVPVRRSMIEHAVVATMREVTPADVTGEVGERDSAEALEAAKARVRTLEDRQSREQTRYEATDDEVEQELYLDQLRRTARALAEARADLDEAERATTRTPAARALAEAWEVMAELEATETHEEHCDRRRRLNRVLLELVERIDVIAEKGGHWRIALGEVALKSGRIRAFGVWWNARLLAPKRTGGMAFPASESSRLLRVSGDGAGWYLREAMRDRPGPKRPTAEAEQYMAEAVATWAEARAGRPKSEGEVEDVWRTRSGEPGCVAWGEFFAEAEAELSDPAPGHQGTPRAGGERD